MNPAALIRLARWLGCLVVAGLPAAVTAQALDQPELRPLTGVLKRIKEARVVRLGVRDAAVPFASINASGQASGYSVDLCLAVVDDIAESIGIGALNVEYRRVTPADRIDQVADGRVDLECGATTNTVERRARVAFSPLIYVAGTRLLVKRGSPVRGLRNLGGRRVAVVRGTTNEAVMRRLAADEMRRLDLVTLDDYDAALVHLASGDVAALAADDVLLSGFVAERRMRNDYAVVGDLLSYEPYGLMYAKDDTPLAKVVEGTFRRLATSGEIRSTYAKWFLNPLPSGVRLGLPMSRELQRSLEVLGMPAD